VRIHEAACLRSAAEEDVAAAVRVQSKQVVVSWVDSLQLRGEHGERLFSRARPRTRALPN